jgi:hypothetical protein
MSTIQAFFIIGIYFFYFISNNNCRLLTTVQVFDIIVYPVTLLTRDADWHKLVTDLFYDFVSVLLVWVAKFKMPSNWKISVTSLHHRLVINVYVGKQGRILKKSPSVINKYSVTKYFFIICFGNLHLGIPSTHTVTYIPLICVGHE